MASVWTKMARTRCPVCVPRWHGQDVQFVGQDGSDKMFSLWVKMTLARESLLWCQEGTRLGRPQLGGELPVSSLGGLRPGGRMFGESPNGGQDVRAVGESPARAVRVAWERYVGKIGGGVPNLSPRSPDLAGGPRGERAV